jgi:DNA invertase Pin-like site-specific DNA recombinase/ssDNA-binding Zn-finger/Zn-ribbon topoisomerase 1
MKKWKIAAYLRLSSDDGDKSESNSIGNQRNIIKQFIKNNNEFNSSVNYYIDDGYSGTTFERPDFSKMINDIKDNKINCIIVKDLSRLGRNYIEVGKYIDEMFPSYNIRFIAINDNVDTYKDPKSTDNVIVPFKNLMNDEYARDISNKVRSVLDNKKFNGQFIGSTAPYGYLRDPNNKYKFIIDKKAGKVVKKIFAMILSGKSKKEVVEELNKMSIATPSSYKMEEGTYNYNYKGNSNIWTSRKLDDILKNKTYTGDLVQGKMKKVSHKVHKTLKVAEDDWIIIPNHHKPLIEKEDFDKVQEILYERTIKVRENKKYDLFAGHLRCNECGGNLVLRQSKGYEYYYCSNFVYKKICTRHACNKKHLEENVIDILNNYKNIITELDRKINNIVMLKNQDYDIEILKIKIDSNTQKLDKYIMLRDNIKNDLQEGFISEEEYWEYSNEYSEEIKKLKSIHKDLVERLNKIDLNNDENKEWMTKFKELKNIEKLDKNIIDELIEDIVIDNDGNIKIIFKYEDKYFEALDFLNKQKCDIM